MHHGHAAWTSGMGMQHEVKHGDMDMQHVQYISRKYVRVRGSVCKSYRKIEKVLVEVLDKI